MQFIWDKKKNLANIKKHGISLETAIHVFDDPYLLSWIDNRYEYGEEGWVGLGAIYHEIVVVVIYTVKSNEDEETIRLVSARKAEKKECTYYFNSIGES